MSHEGAISILVVLGLYVLFLIGIIIYAAKKWS